jgi:hypothetical protein
MFSGPEPQAARCEIPQRGGNMLSERCIQLDESRFRVELATMLGGVGSEIAANLAALPRDFFNGSSVSAGSFSQSAASNRRGT